MDFMPDFIKTNGQTQLVIPLKIKPHRHKAMPTITGSAFSYEAGTVLYGNYNMEYLLSGGDRLRLIANHNQKTVQLMLFTHNSDLLKLLPGDRPSSLVANIINKIHRYRIRAASYMQPLSLEQQKKVQICNEAIDALTQLLKQERKLNIKHYAGHEQLRKQVISIIEKSSDSNRLIANNPIVSEGTLGVLLYNAHQTAQHYQFNRIYPVSRQDQADFSNASKNNGETPLPPCFIWDSEVHIEHNKDDLDDALRVICHYYKLTPAAELNELPANRFAKVEAFVRSLWNDGQDWINYLAIPEKPAHKTQIDRRSDGITITEITPYYKFKGLAQDGYSSLADLVYQLTEQANEPILANTSNEAKQKLATSQNGHWAIIAIEHQIIIRQENKLVQLGYFLKDQLFYPLPEGQDLYTLSQISKRHLYLPERLSLRLKGFISSIPTFFKNFFNSMTHFIVHELHEDFITHIHAGHNQLVENKTIQSVPNTSLFKKSTLHDILENNGLLANGQTLEEFIKEQINKNPYIIARANHPPSPRAYENPLHRLLDTLRHFGGFFIDTSERNPMIGTLAMAAYAYGAGAIIAPEALTSILTKLHLSGLISGIKPTQQLAHWMSHGTISEAISASVTLWQGMVAGGNLDAFLMSAITLFKDDPGEIAIILALTLGLGCAITNAVPSLQKEIGEFPYVQYLAFGAKGDAAAYDTFTRPGDDWLLGTCKWLCKNTVSLGKLLIAPFVEGYFYGAHDGFINAWKKSWVLLKRIGKQILAASADFILALITVPLLELSALFIHVPFRGITNVLQKTLASLGNISIIGQLFIDIARRPSTSNFLSEFRCSPLYGFSSPLGHYSEHWLLNISINIIRFVFLPPLQLVKNIIVLPLIDCLSLLTRVCFTVLNPVTRVMAYAAGIILYYGGLVWDNSIGILCSSSANWFTVFCNWIDNKAGEGKQEILAQIKVIRSELFNWAFHDEDVLLHSTSTDEHYFHSKPGRCELIPHKEKDCLIYHLLHNENRPVYKSDTAAPDAYKPLFQQIKERASTINSEINDTNLQNTEVTPNIN